MSGGELIAHRESGNLSPGAGVSLDPESREETLLPGNKGEVGTETTVAIGYENVALDRR